MDSLIDDIIQNRYALFITIAVAAIAALIYVFKILKFLKLAWIYYINWFEKVEESRSEKKGSAIAVATHDPQFLMAETFFKILKILILIYLTTQFSKIGIEIEELNTFGDRTYGVGKLLSAFRYIFLMAIGLYTGELYSFLKKVRKNRIDKMAEKYPDIKDWKF